MKNSSRNKVLSLNINVGNYNWFLEQIMSKAKLNKSSYVCVANVHMTIEAHWDRIFTDVVNGADLVTPDGMPVVKVMKLLYGIKQDRVAGMDLLPDLLKKAEEQNLGVFFYGGTDEMLLKTKEHIIEKYPKLNNHYYYRPPFRPLTEEEESNIVKIINDSEAHIVFVALGCPKQEKWMASMKGKINTCMIGIGGALPVVIGIQKRAPLWMQKMSLEWIFRLFQEPKRLFKRYFITNSLFIVLFFKQWLKKIFHINPRLNK